MCVMQIFFLSLKMCVKLSLYILRRYAADKANFKTDIVQSRM